MLFTFLRVPLKSLGDSLKYIGTNMNLKKEVWALFNFRGTLLELKEPL